MRTSILVILFSLIAFQGFSQKETEDKDSKKSKKKDSKKVEIKEEKVIEIKKEDKKSPEAKPEAPKAEETKAQDETGTPLKATEDKILFHFFISDYNDIPEEGAVITLEHSDSTLSRKGISNIDGKFDVLLPKGKTFKLNVFKFNENFDFDTMTVPVVKGAVNFESQLKIRVIKRYIRTYNLDNLYFDTGKWDIKTESLPPLNALFHALTKNPKMKVEIAGHTDNVGDDQSNMQLSQKRANSVVEWLKQKGISKDRLIAKGYGKTAPVESNDTAEGRQKNRRTEVRVIEE